MNTRSAGLNVGAERSLYVFKPNGFPNQSQNLNDVWKSVKTALVKEALRRTSRVKKDAANLLGISVDSFKYHSKIIEV